MWCFLLVDISKLNPVDGSSHVAAAAASDLAFLCLRVLFLSLLKHNTKTPSGFFESDLIPFFFLSLWYSLLVDETHHPNPVGKKASDGLLSLLSGHLPSVYISFRICFMRFLSVSFG